MLRIGHRHSKDIDLFVPDPQCLGFVSPRLSEVAEQVSTDYEENAEASNCIERRLPVFASPRARSGRYYIRDNFLRAWLHALQRPVSSVAFRPLPGLIELADQRLQEAEGHALENLAAQLYAERSRQGVGDFNLSERIGGYGDRSDVEIDLVAVDADSRRLRLATCKRNPARLPAAAHALRQHGQRFLALQPRFQGWVVEYAAIAPRLPADVRSELAAQQVIAQDLDDLTTGLAA